MLDSLRSAIDTWYSKALLGILVLSFAILWGAPQLTHNQGSGVLKFGDTSLSLNDALMSEGDTLYRVSSFFNGPGQGLTVPKEVFISQQANIFAQKPLHYFFPAALRLMNEVVLEETANQYKIGASIDAIRYEINNDPIFKGANNTFDQQYFNRYASSLENVYKNYISSSNIENYFAYYAKRDQMLSAVSGDAKLPNVFFDAFNHYKNETRTINYITISPAIIGDLTISDADLAKWFNTNKNRYLSPEYREVSYITLTSKNITNPTELKQIHDEIDTSWYNGSDLSEIAKNFSLTVQTVVFDANGLTTTGKAVEGLPQSQLVASSFQADVGFHEAPLTIPQNGGYVWYQVDKTIEPRSKTLAEVHDQALQDWKAETTINRVNEKVKAIQQEIVLQGKTLSQIAEENGLKLNTQTGLQRGQEISTFSPIALSNFFVGPKGQVAVTNGLTPSDYVVFEVSDVTHPANAPSIATDAQNIFNIALQYDINNAFIQGRIEEEGGVKIVNQPQLQQLTQVKNDG